MTNDLEPQDKPTNLTPPEGTSMEPTAVVDLPEERPVPAAFSSPVPTTHPIHSYVPVQPSQPARTPRFGGLLAGMVALSLGSGLTGAALVTAFDQESGPASISAPVITETIATDPTESLAQVAALVGPSVVSIEVTTPTSASSGSGVIFDADGAIITNNHVIESAAESGEITVRFHDGITSSATILGRDPVTDLAVLKVEGVEGLTPAKFASVNSLHVGDSVLALGSPLGLEGSVSSGIISALERTVNLGSSEEGPALVSDAIQTDAAVNPGNSGGPLVNIKGEVIGINTAIASLGISGSQSGSIGLGFAINSDQVQDITSYLIEGKAPVRALLGVSVSDAPEGGAKVEEVSPASAADGSVQAGDIITAVDDEEVRSAQDLTALIRGQKPDDKIKLTLTRNGDEVEVEVTLQASK